MSQHKAASVSGVGKPIEVVNVTTSSVGSDQILVKAHAVATNPADWYLQDTGLFVDSWPAIFGADMAGEVVEIGADVQKFKKGDRVLVATTAFATHNQAEAGFQELVLAPALAAVKIPDDMKYSEATVIPLSASTAAAGLYQKDALGLDYPSTDVKPKDQKLLVWGASSSVAASVIQLGVASGYEIVATASKRNFDYVKSLGASKVFDYNSPSIVGDLTEELQKGKFAGAFDAISSNDTQLAVATVVAQLGGGKVACVRQVAEGIPATVEAKMIFAPIIFTVYKDVAQAVFQDYLPKALASGQFVAQPKPEIVGTGLESIQNAINIHKAGVSAKKIVVTL